MKPFVGAAEIRSLLREVYLEVAGDPHNGKAKLMLYERIKQIDTEEAEKFLDYATFLGATTMPPPVINNFGTIGTLITGHVDAMNTALNIVSKQGVEGADFSNSLKNLTEGVLGEANLNEGQKRNALELLSQIGKEAQTPPEQRSGVLKTALEALPKVLSSTASLSALWAAHGTQLIKFFGL